MFDWIESTWTAIQRAQQHLASRFRSQPASLKLPDDHVTDSDQPARTEPEPITHLPGATLRGDPKTKSEVLVKTLSAFVCF
jgi:hypothetical protein